MNGYDLTREIAPELPPNGEDHEPEATGITDVGVYPMNDKLLIRRDAEREMIGSIVVAEANREKQVVGTVLAVGPGKVADGLFQGQLILIPPRVPVGARVLFGRFAGADVPEEFGAGLVMCREDELLAILR